MKLYHQVAKKMPLALYEYKEYERLLAKHRAAIRRGERRRDRYGWLPIKDEMNINNIHEECNQALLRLLEAVKNV